MLPHTHMNILWIKVCYWDHNPSGQWKLKVCIWRLPVLIHIINKAYSKWQARIAIFTYSISSLTNTVMCCSSSCGFQSFESFQSESISVYGHHALVFCSCHLPSSNPSLMYWRHPTGKYLLSKKSHRSLGQVQTWSPIVQMVKFQVFSAPKK